MARVDRVSELDLLAYADGLLDADPHHKAAVEAALRADPARWARARELCAQTEALRAAYGRRLAEPVPERMIDVLRAPSRTRAHSSWLRSTAAVLLVLAAGAAGWMLGQSGSSWDAGSVATVRLSDRGLAQFLAERPGEDGPAISTSAGATPPMDWLSDELTISLRAPDMASEGYALLGKTAVTADGERVVRLDYVGEDGQSFSLFLAPRWEVEQQEITEVRRGDVAIASWVDGPLASAIVARLSSRETRELADAVRRAMQAEGGAPGLLPPPPVDAAVGAPDAIADMASPPSLEFPKAAPQTAEPATLAPQTVGDTVPN